MTTQRKHLSPMSRTLLHVSPRIMSPLGIYDWLPSPGMLVHGNVCRVFHLESQPMQRCHFGECQRTLSAQSHCCPLGDTLDHCCLLKTHGVTLECGPLVLVVRDQVTQDSLQKLSHRSLSPTEEDSRCVKERDDCAGTVYHAWGADCLLAMCTTWYPVLRHKELCHSSLQRVCTVSLMGGLEKGKSTVLHCRTLEWRLGTDPTTEKAGEERGT